MIRPLQPIDVARYALSGGKGGSSRAYTMDRLRGATQSRLSLVEAARISVPLPRRSVCSWALVRSNRIVTIAAARPRSGPQTWEVSLLLTASDDDPGCIELLSQVCQGVARNGGETVFIRLVSDDPLVDVARLSGFAPCTSELLFCIAGRHATHSSRPVSLRKKSPADEYNLFQLFNASTPAESRFTFGMTFDRWKASQERSRGRRREFVYETDGDLRGWVKTSKGFGAGQLPGYDTPARGNQRRHIVRLRVEASGWSSHGVLPGAGAPGALAAPVVAAGVPPDVPVHYVGQVYGRTGAYRGNPPKSNDSLNLIRHRPGAFMWRPRSRAPTNETGTSAGPHALSPQLTWSRGRQGPDAVAERDVTPPPFAAEKR